MEMASRNKVHHTHLVNLIFLIQTLVCFLDATNVVQLHLNSSILTRLRTCVCNSSCMFHHSKHDSHELDQTDTDQPGQDRSFYKIFKCGYHRSSIEERFECNRIQSFKPTTDERTDMHINCGNNCVDIFWVNVKVFNMCSELQGNCTDSNNTSTNATVTTGCFDSTSTPQPASPASLTQSSTATTAASSPLSVSTTPKTRQSASNTSLTQSSTATTAASSLLPVWISPTIQHPASDTSLIQSSSATTVASSPLAALTTCTHIAIIASTVSTCIVLIIVGLVIIVFLRKRKNGKLELHAITVHATHATHSLENSNDLCLPDGHVGDGNSAHCQDNAQMQLAPGHPNTGASCTVSAATSNVGGDDDVVAGYASVGECHLTDVYARLREQPSRTPDTYHTLGNVVKVVDDKASNTTINSGLLTRNHQGTQVIDLSTNFEHSSANNDKTSSVHKSNRPSSEHPGYAQVVKKPERKSKKMESATVISDSDYNSSNKGAASTSADVESTLRQQDSTISDVYNIMP